MGSFLNINMLSSTHINFLFGAGVNGGAFPQLDEFSETKKALKNLKCDISDGLESGIDSLQNYDERERIRNTFVDEFKKYQEERLRDSTFFDNVSVKNIKDLLRKTYSIVQNAQNRNPSMRQVNIYTLNYDSIIEKTLTEMGYLFNEISASNTSTKASLLNVIGYDYKTRKHVPTFMISKLHGDIDNPIIPGKTKYEEILNENYFEVAFNMKEQLCQQNSILIVIGYSGNDKHINRIIEECINVGLIVLWYRYSEKDTVPFPPGNQVRIRDQEDQNNKQDSTKTCYIDMEQVWGEKLAE